MNAVNYFNNGFEGKAVPLLVSIALHSVLLIFITWGWQSAPVVKHIKTPSYINAQLIKMEPKVITPKKTISRPKPPREKKKEIRRETQSNNMKKKKTEAQNMEKLKTVQQSQLEQQKISEAERTKQIELEKHRQAEEALALALADEDEFLQEQSEHELAQSYAHLIKQRVETNWSRPPSAKYGMEVLLEIQLVPTGHVVGVIVLRGSGNAAFDLSAEQAVRKVERFVEIKNMPSNLFESRFRRFQLLFRPEDKLS